MAQLFFEYGVMRSGKSIEILKVAYNYEAQDKEVLLMTPHIDSRDGIGTVASRIGLKKPARVIKEDDNLYQIIKDTQDQKQDKLAAVLIDEAQFLTVEQVDQLAYAVDNLNLPVMTFGLKQDAFNNLFPGSKRLIEIADKLEEMKTICAFCGRKATTQLRIVDGKPVYSGNQIMIGGDDFYIPTCRKHWHNPEVDRIDQMFNK